MPGVNGATKLNNVAPTLSATETDNVSAFKVYKNTENAVKNEEISVAKPTRVVKERVETEKDAVIVEMEAPAVEVKGVDDTLILNAIEKLNLVVKNLYETVFNKTPNFRPTYDETIGDALLYVGKKLYAIGAHESFEFAVKIDATTISSKYLDASYIPLAVKLSTWAESKGYNGESENVLSAITKLYKECSEASGYKVTPESLTDTFLAIIDFAYGNKK